MQTYIFDENGEVANVELITDDSEFRVYPMEKAIRRGKVIEFNLVGEKIDGRWEYFIIISNAEEEVEK